MISVEQIQSLIGGDAVDPSDAKIGSIGQVYLDDQSGQPAWVTVKTGLFGTSETFVPLNDAEADGDALKVPYTKDKVKDAPRIDADQHLGVDQQQKLYEYYGLAYGHDTAKTGQEQGEFGNVGIPRGRESQDDDGAGERRRDLAGEPGVKGRDTSGPTTDQAMTRSEEQLNVGTEKVETGRARLRKYIVTENVTTTVPVSHEEVRVVREPITEQNRGDAIAGGDLTEEEHEVTLHAERPVVEKETVPVERVRLDTETVAGEQEVTEEVRKEKIETDADATARQGRDDR